MKKILYLANLNPNKFGSMEEHALFLSRELQARGHQCYLGFISEPETEIRRQFEKVGAKVLTFYCGNTPLVGGRASFSLKEMLALRRMVVDNGIDLVHINFMAVTNPSLLGVYFTRAKIIFAEHASGAPPRRAPIKQLISRCIHAVVSRRISKYIGVSDFVRNRLKVTHHVPDEKTVTIYNGVNVERFSPRDRNEARMELELPLDIPIVCSVAMLIPEKGIQHLIKAVSILVKDNGLPDLLALVVGEGWYRLQLETLVKDLGVEGNVRFLGRRSDVQTLIAASDAVVVPSVWEEAFGLIVAEAMACERPLVASHSGGIPELVEDGFTGLLVPSGDTQRMAEAIKVLLSNMSYRKELATNGRLKTLDKFNLEKQVDSLVDFYNVVLNYER